MSAVSGRPGAGSGAAERTGWAFVALTAAAVLSSFMVPALGWFAAERAPFLFNGFWKLGLSVACGLLFLAGGRGLLAYAAAAGWLANFWRRPAFWGGSVVALGFGLGGMAGRFVDYSLVTALLELYPLAVAGFMPWALGQEAAAAAARRRSRRRVGGWVALAFLGVGLVALSQEGGFGGGAGVLPLLLGGGLALGGAVAYGCVVFTFRLGGTWAWEYRRALAAGRAAGRGDLLAPEILALLLATALTAGVGGLLNLVIGLALGEVPAAAAAGPGWLAAAFLAGLLLNGPISVCFRLANAWTTNVGVNAVFYLTMPLSLLWLGLFVGVAVAWPGVLLLGAGLVVAANVMIALGGGAVSLRAGRRRLRRLRRRAGGGQEAGLGAKGSGLGSGEEA